MSRIGELLRDPAWWASAVVVALIVNLAAAYLKPNLDRALGHLGGRWKLAADRRREDFAAEVAELRHSVDKRLTAWFLLTIVVLGELGFLLMFSTFGLAFLILHHAGKTDLALLCLLGQAAALAFGTALAYRVVKQVAALAAVDRELEQERARE